jgi:hypothetical protein
VKALLVRAGLALAVVAGLLTVGPSTAVASPVRDFHDVIVTGWMHVKDDERRRDDIGDHTMKKQTFHMLDGGEIHGHTWTACRGKEVYVDFRLDVARISGRPGWARVTTKGMLFEATSWDAVCGGHDLEDLEKMSFDVPPNTKVDKVMHVETKERRSDDYADIHFSVNNYHVEH